MATPAEVTWVKTDTSGTEIVALGGRRRTLFGSIPWQLKAADAIAMIEQDEWRFFVDGDEGTCWLEVHRASDGDKSLRGEEAVQALL